MSKRMKILHNLDEMEEDEEIELQLEDQLILDNNHRINEDEDVLFNKDLKNKFQRDFYQKQMRNEEVEITKESHDSRREKRHAR
jgi:hypothetical protein